ncbi:MAG: spermidine synthase [Sulfurimonas sp.]|nr:spermidine synthase [Sulfurimonadaceae bacterium]
MRDFIYAEMMVHVPTCTSKEPKNVLVISGDSKIFEDELKKYSEGLSVSVAKDLDGVSSLGDAIFDVAICENEIDATLLAHLNRVLKIDGLISVANVDLGQVEASKKLISLLGTSFKIVMPYFLGDNSKTALLCSKEYHPTADVNLHRADMLDGLDYYNSDVHRGVFAMGNYIRKEYLGVIKN